MAIVSMCSKHNKKLSILSFSVLIVLNFEINEVKGLNLNLSMLDPKIYTPSKIEQNRTRALLRFFSLSHIGGFMSSSYCSSNGASFFSAARIRLSSVLNQHYPMVSAIEFLCSDGIHKPSKADGTLLLQKNLGNWTTMKECPYGGFITGITLFMQTVSSASFLADEDKIDTKYKLDNNRFFDIFDLGRSRYISGVSLNCSFNRENDVSVDDSANDEGLRPIWKNTVAMGHPYGMGVKMYCPDNRVISGITIEQEALITYENGERWIPTDIKTTCSRLTNPVKYCYPELDWERIDNMTCANVETRNNVTYSQNLTGLANVTCHVPHFVGLHVNHDIENLFKILRAYEPVKLDGIFTRISLRSKLFTSFFQKEWQRKYNLSMSDYIKTVLVKPFGTYLDIKQEIHVTNFTNVSYEEPEYCKSIRNQKTEPLKHDFSVKQLVGYCSIYKIYFPLFRTQFQSYFERKIDNINSRIIFPQEDDVTSLADIVQTKLGFIQALKF